MAVLRPWVVAALLLLPAPVAAQRAASPAASTAAEFNIDLDMALPAGGRFLSQPWMRPVASLLVPGSGQLAAGQQHGLVYLAAEVWLIARALTLDSRGRRERERYRDLAFRVARSSFTAERLDGPFTYYESMERYVESGSYDLDPGSGFLPEGDTATFNGATWLLARRTFFENPDSLPALDSPQYLAALSFYQSTAVVGGFRWSWRDARLEQDAFRQTIRASDEAFRSATNYLGAIVVNHLVSAVDALIANRRAQAISPRVRVSPDGSGMTLLWSLGF